MWESTSKLSRLVIHSSVRLGIKNKRRRRYEAIPLQIESTWDEKWGTKLWKLTDLTSDRSLMESQRNQMMFDVYELHSQSRHNLYRLKHNNRKQTMDYSTNEQGSSPLIKVDVIWIRTTFLEIVSYIANNENRFSSSNWRSPIWRSVV